MTAIMPFDRRRAPCYNERHYVRGGDTVANVLVIDSRDTVGVALMDLPAGTAVELNGGRPTSLVTTELIPFGHKIALVAIGRGETIVKYGASIGVAVDDIQPGMSVHVHNLKSVRGAAR